MGPHANDFDDAFFFQDLIHEAMVDVDAAGICARQIADQLFKGRVSLKWVLFQHCKKLLRFFLQSGGGQLLGISLRLFGVDEAPFHHLRFLAHFSTGVFSPFRMDSLMPGIESR